MHLLREGAFTLVGGLAVWLGPLLGGGVGPGFLAGLVATMPFQASFALGLMAAPRLPWPVSVLLAGAAWGWGWQGLGLGRHPWLGLIPVLLILAAAARGRGAAVQRAAAALMLWCVPLSFTLWVLTATVPGPAGGPAAAAARNLLMIAGTVYLTIRLLAAVFAPLPVDRPFFRAPPAGS